MQSTTVFAGVDVSAATLAVCRGADDAEQEREFQNDIAGHRAIVKWLGKKARVCLEATGVYHLQFALTLHEAGLEVTVLNPRVAKDYARALSSRSKTDRVDARVLRDYARRMAFVPWQPPSRGALELRELGRRLKELVETRVAETNRLHARETSAISKAVIADGREHVRQLTTRIRRIENAAIAVVNADPDLREQYRFLVAGTGIGRRSAILLLGELAVLDPCMTVREIVAHMGLDPRVYESGSSVQKPSRISKVGNAHVRAILYMVALPAIRYDRGARAFYARLLARGKKPMQAIVAVMRKMLHGVWTVMQQRMPFDNTVLFAASLAQAESSDSAVAASKPQQEQSHPKDRSEAKDLRQQIDSAPAEATPGQPLVRLTC